MSAAKQGLSLYDSMQQTKRAFVPIVEGQVGIYVCGPTVQSEPHAGHLRSALVYDVFRNWLTAIGYQVRLVRNVTDIDDKILDNAPTRGLQWQQLATQMHELFTSSYERLGIAAPTAETFATEYIEQMQSIISKLIERGYAYQATDGSANVYFAAGEWADYGELTNQRLADMEGAEDSAPGKRANHDFALWKAHKQGEPDTAAWSSPWGKGRPGWHIECSAMSTESLGAHFDIHGGGLDLRFPHHENELAQSRAAGFEYANYWMHNGLVNLGGTKMSKSLGNVVLASDLFEQDPRGIAVRYYLMTAHYRATLDYHDGIIEEARSNIERIENFLRRAAQHVASVSRHVAALNFDHLPVKFVQSMNDDLNVPAALAELFETIRRGNAAIDAGEGVNAETAAASVIAMLNVLNINPLASKWQSNATHVDEAKIQKLVDDRNAARARKDFAEADAIRDELTSMGVTIEDAAEKTHWSVD